MPIFQISRILLVSGILCFQRVKIHKGFLIYIISLCSGQFGGQKSLGPFERPIEMADNVFCLHIKITSSTFRISGTLIVKIVKSQRGSIDEGFMTHALFYSPITYL
jgi:hypothetical protein